jgi:hypothetical protein
MEVSNHVHARVVLTPVRTEYRDRLALDVIRTLSSFLHAHVGFSNQSSYWSLFRVRSKLHVLTLRENFRNFLHVCLGVLYFDARRHEYQYQLLTALLRNSIFSAEVTHGLRVNRHVKILSGALSLTSDYMLNLLCITNNTRRWVFFHFKLYFFRAHQTLFHTGYMKPYHVVYPVKNFCCVMCRLSS